MTYIADLKQGVVREKTEMEEPDELSYCMDSDDGLVISFERDRYKRDRANYTRHIASLKTYPILPGNWVDGWEYPESWIEIVKCDENKICDLCKHDTAKWDSPCHVARLKQQPIETQEEMWMDVYQSTNDDNYDRWEDRIKSKYTITHK